MGTPVPFEIQYTNGIAWFRLGTSDEGWICYPVAEDVFMTTNGVAHLTFRARSVLTNSSVALSDMVLTTTSGNTNLPSMYSLHNAQDLLTVSNQML
jgi:hypothetical protein